MRDVLPKRTEHDTAQLVAPLGKDAPVPEASICYRQHAVVTQTSSSRRVLTSSPKVSHIPATPLSAQRIGLAWWQADGTPSDKAPKALDGTPSDKAPKGLAPSSLEGLLEAFGLRVFGATRPHFCCQVLNKEGIAPGHRKWLV